LYFIASDENLVPSGETNEQSFGTEVAGVTHASLQFTVHIGGRRLISANAFAHYKVSAFFLLFDRSF